MFKGIFKTLEKKEKQFFLVLLFLILVNAALETIGIAAIIPLISLIMQDDFLNKYSFISNFLMGTSEFILPNDSQRSIRAYEVKKFTNKSLFEFIKETKSNFENNIFKKIFINTPKDILNKKIERRVEKMFKDGAVDEVKKFLKIKVYRELSSNKIIGIKEIKDHLRGKITITAAKDLIALKTRQYAKRQFTWARGHMKSWEMIYSPNINDLFKKVINKIS